MKTKSSDFPLGVHTGSRQKIILLIQASQLVQNHSTLQTSYSNPVENTRSAQRGV